MLGFLNYLRWFDKVFLETTFNNISNNNFNNNNSSISNNKNISNNNKY